MKKLVLLAALATAAFTSGYAQEKTPDAPRGYWVVEDNVKQPKKATIYFYNHEHQVVHQKTVEGKRTRAWKPRVSRRLNAELRQSLEAWAVRTRQEAVLAQTKQ